MMRFGGISSSRCALAGFWADFGWNLPGTQVGLAALVGSGNSAAAPKPDSHKTAVKGVVCTAEVAAASRVSHLRYQPRLSPVIEL